VKILAGKISKWRFTLAALAASVCFSAMAQEAADEPSVEDWPFACVPPDFSAVGRVIDNSSSDLALHLLTPSSIRIPVTILTSAASNGTLLVATETSKKYVATQWELFQRYRMKLNQQNGLPSRDVVAVHCPTR
jgi:hypothetical protein